MEMVKWMWRGLLTRLGMMAAQIPPPPHRRDPEVSKHFQVEPFEEQELVPRNVSEERKQAAQHHPHPADRQGTTQR